MSAYARAQGWPNHHPMPGTRRLVRGDRRPWMGPPRMYTPSPWYWDGQEDMEPRRCWHMEHPNMRPHHPPHHCCHRGRYDDCCYNEDLPDYYEDFENEKSPFEYFKDFCGEKMNEREGPNSCFNQSFDFGDLSKMLTSLMKQQRFAEEQKQKPQFQRSRSKLESGAANMLPSKRRTLKKQMSCDHSSASKGKGENEFVVMKTPYGDLYLKPNPTCSKKKAPNVSSKSRSSAKKMSDPTRPIKSVGRQASRDSGEGWKMVDTKFGPVMVKYIPGDTHENNEDRKTDYECPPNRKRKMNDEEAKYQHEHTPIDMHHTLTDTTTEKPLLENSCKKESAHKSSHMKADAKERQSESDGLKLVNTALGPMLVMDCTKPAHKTEDDKLPNDKKKMDSNRYEVVNTILGPMLVKVDDKKEIKHENEKQEMPKPTFPKRVNCNISIQTHKQETSGNQSISRDRKSEVEKTSAQENSKHDDHSKQANVNESNVKVVETPYGPVVVVGNSDDSEKIENDTKGENDRWEVINTMFGPMLVKQTRDEKDKNHEKPVQKAQENKKNFSCEIPIDITKTKKDEKMGKDQMEDNKKEGSGETLQDHQPSKSKTAINSMNSQQELKHKSEETLTEDSETRVHEMQELIDVPEITVMTSEEVNESESSGLQKFKTEEALDAIAVDDSSVDEGFEERDGLSHVSMEVQVNDDLDVSSLFTEENEDDDYYPQVPSLVELATAQMSQETFDDVDSKKIENERDSPMKEVQEEDENSNAEKEKIINQKQDTIRNETIEKTDCSEEIAVSDKLYNSTPSSEEPKKKCDVPTKEQLHVKGVVSYNADHSEWSVTFNLQHFAQDSISVRVVSHDIVVEAERLLPSGEVYSLVKDIPIPTNYDPDTVACFMDDGGNLRVKADRRKIKDHRFIPISGRD